jgi:hypothetical protein
MLRTMEVRLSLLVRLVGFKRVATMHAGDGLPRRCLLNRESIVGGHGGWSLHASHADRKQWRGAEEKKFQR